MSDQVEAFVVTSSRWDRVAAFVMALAAIGLAAMSGFRLGAILLLSVPLVVLARALWIRRVEATSKGLRLNDGLFRHDLEWSDVDGLVVCPRSSLERSTVHLLHHGRFIDVLPLPVGGFGQCQSTTAESVAPALIGLKEAHGEAVAPEWCPVRIVGGLRGRMGMTVAVVDSAGRFEWLIAPWPSWDWLAFLLRRSARRHRAEAVRAEAAAERGWPPTPV